MSATGHCSATTPLGAGVGTSTLPPDRQPPTMAEATIRSDVYKTPYVGVDFTAQVPFDELITVHNLSYAVQLLLGQVSYTRIFFDVSSISDVLGLYRPNAENTAQGHLYSLVVGNIYSRDYRHVSSSEGCKHALNLAAVCASRFRKLPGLAPSGE